MSAPRIGAIPDSPSLTSALPPIAYPESVVRDVLDRVAGRN